MPGSSANPTPSLRILVVVEPGFDGVFRHVVGLVHFLLGRQQEVHLAYSDKRGSPELSDLVSIVQKRGGHCLNLEVSNAPQPGDLRALHRLRKFAARLQPHIIHAHSSKAGVLGRTLALLGQESSYFYTPHAYYGLVPRSGLTNHFYNGIERFYGRVGQTINISEDERAFARQTLGLSPERSLLIPIAIDTDHFKPSSHEEKLSLRKQLGLPEEGLILGSMGRLSFQKDPHTLYRAFALARQQGRDFHLLHVGEGQEAENLEKLARDLNLNDRLLRIPYLRDPRQFHGAIDALILTSRYEGCPTVAVEALSSDLPLILSDAPGTHWLAQCGLTHCWTAPVGNVPGFAQAMNDWLNDIPLQRPRNHRAYAVEHFNIETRYDDILHAYREAAAKNRHLPFSPAQP